MDFLLAFALFSAGLAVCLSNGVSIIVPLLLGLLFFAGTAFHRGFPLRSIAQMTGRGIKKSLIVLRIFVLIGLLTAVWRAGGTISFFVYYGIDLITPRFFVLFAFVLSSLISYALGTCFGTAGTIGVVLMVLARSGGVDANVVAGAILSGAFFGDRCAPTSSSANLVANLTETRLYDNVRNLFKTAFVPTLLSLLIYGYFSIQNPMQSSDTAILSEIASTHNLGAVVSVPALVVLLLPFFGLDVKASMLLSILTGSAIALWVQHVPPVELLHYMLVGYESGGDGRFAQIIAGGGLISMLRVSGIVLIASTTSGIFDGAGLLDGVQGFLERLSRRVMLYPTTVVTAIFTNMFACNQTLAVILTHQLMQKIYDQRGVSRSLLAVDLGNTAILIAGLIPWSIAAAVPISMLAADSRCLPYAVFLWLVPLTNFFRRTLCRRLINTV